VGKLQEKKEKSSCLIDYQKKEGRQLERGSYWQRLLRGLVVRKKQRNLQMASRRHIERIDRTKRQVSGSLSGISKEKKGLLTGVLQNG